MKTPSTRRERSPSRSVPVCVVQHIPCEPPGLIAETLDAEGVGIHLVRTFAGQEIPRDMKPYRGLVVMGGPMSAYEQDRHPHLREEMRLIERALADEKPILGVCLGSQMLAVVLGAPVGPGKRKEIGWVPITLSPDAGRDPLWADTPRQFTAYSWHGDIFELPRKAVPLASSDLTECQAFRYGGNAHGILFHMEVAEPIVDRMVSAFADELREANVDGGQILKETRRHLPALQNIGRSVFRRWSRQARSNS